MRYLDQTGDDVTDGDDDDEDEDDGIGPCGDVDLLLTSGADVNEPNSDGEVRGATVFKSIV